LIFNNCSYIPVFFVLIFFFALILGNFIVFSLALIFSNNIFIFFVLIFGGIIIFSFGLFVTINIKSYFVFIIGFLNSGNLIIQFITIRFYTFINIIKIVNFPYNTCRANLFLLQLIYFLI